MQLEHFLKFVHDIGGAVVGTAGNGRSPKLDTSPASFVELDARPSPAGRVRYAVSLRAAGATSEHVGSRWEPDRICRPDQDWGFKGARWSGAVAAAAYPNSAARLDAAARMIGTASDRLGTPP